MSRPTAPGRAPGSSASRPGRQNGESGQALLELALVAPILIFLVMAIFQFAFVFETHMGLANATREAARRAAAAPNPTTGWVRQQLCGADVSNCNGGLLAENVHGFNAARLSPSNTVSISFCTYPVSSIANYRVEISVTYLNPVFFGLLSFATDRIDGVSDGNWTASESAEMRLEHDLVGAAPCP